MSETSGRWAGSRKPAVLRTSTIGSADTPNRQGLEIEGGVHLYAAELFFNEQTADYFGYGVVHLHRSGEWGVVTMGTRLVRGLLRTNWRVIDASLEPPPGITRTEKPIPVSTPTVDVMPAVGPFLEFSSAFNTLFTAITTTKRADQVSTVPLPPWCPLQHVVHPPGASAHPLPEKVVERPVGPPPAVKSKEPEPPKGHEQLRHFLGFLYAYRDAILAVQEADGDVDFDLSDEEYLKQMFLLAKF